MTELYEWYPFPDEVSVKCPACAGEAKFLFALAAQVFRKSTIGSFKGNRSYEHLVTDHEGPIDLILFFRGLDGVETMKPTIEPKHETLNWHIPRTPRGWNAIQTGVLFCTKCGLRKKHVLKWPADAYYQVSYKSNTLWAFDRETVIDLKAYVETHQRDPKQFRTAGFLRHIPTVFLDRRAREAISQKLARVLSETAP